MKVSKIVLSTAAAISMVGALGLAYAADSMGTSGTMNQNSTGVNAQGTSGTANTTGTTPQGSDNSLNASDTAARGTGDTMSQDSTDSTSTTTRRSGTGYNQRVARADRN